MIAETCVIFPSSIKQHNLAFGRTLRAFRLERRLSQDSLAFDSGLDRTYISLLELGIRSPTLNTMIALCLALNISLDAFVHQMEISTEREPT